MQNDTTTYFNILKNAETMFSGGTFRLGTVMIIKRQKDFYLNIASKWWGGGGGGDGEGVAGNVGCLAFYWAFHYHCSILHLII